MQIRKDLGEVANLPITAVAPLEKLIEYGRDKLNESSRSLSFMSGMARQLIDLGKADLAGQYLEQAKEASRAHARALCFLAECRIQLGDFVGANDLFRQAMIFDPHFIDARIALGRGLVERGELTEAVTVLEEALQSAPDDLRLRYFLGEAFRRQSNVDGAEDCFRSIVTAFPMRRPGTIGTTGEQAFIWEIFSQWAILGLHETFKWRCAIESVGMSPRDVARLERIARGRPIYLTTIEGRGWVLSHMVSQIEMFLRQLWLDGVRDPFVIVLNPNRFSNPSLTRMYRRSIWMVDDRYPRLRRRLIAAREILRQRRSPIAVDIDRDNPRPHEVNRYSADQLKGWLAAPPTLRFSASEERAGRLELQRVGIPDGAQHVCWGVREATYYAEAWSDNTNYKHYWEANLPSVKASKEFAVGQNQRIPASIPDAMHTPLENYLPMAEMMARKGIYALRMGLHVDRPLPKTLDPRVIDYASRFRSDFTDIYLFAKSKFVVAGGTGITWINAAFGKPFVVTDLYLPNHLCFNTDPGGLPNLVLPRLYWYASEKRFLSFAESFKVCRHYQKTLNCLRDGIEHVPNTAEEIMDVVAEMDARIDGTWIESPEDAGLQAKFHGLLQPHDEGYGINGRVGAAFLRAHRDLLGPI